ncbi:hypothetical protein QEJ31_10265 [Pigmentibacter sp. JX0631]|uniref:hypothetical protein n=1 Tax=Pigmentibacter sp. JX0631 TaxID=2976982 RepID=UPI002468A724|nr:hypothetical protein [Pigmentibacter sp. JX0631]WGL58906.1 hypothetical protein QEJ31_10265 [Pigmentibacter sp. JX0631]
MKKKARENNFTFLTCFFCSIIIHLFLFLLYYKKSIKNITPSPVPYNNIVHLEFVKKATEIPAPPVYSSKVPHKQEFQKNKKNTFEGKKSSFIETKAIPEFKEKQNKIDNNEMLDSSLSQQIIQVNPIESLKLPKNLLGKNIFPKQYKVYFHYKRENNTVVNIAVNKFEPLTGNLLYVDKLIEKAFLKELSDLTISEISAWLQQYQKHQYASENIENPSKDNFYIVLEFQEPN